MSNYSNFSKIEGSGAVLVAAEGFVGMVTLKADLSSKATCAEIKTILGVAVPKARKHAGGVAWMAPDELLILTQFGQDPDDLVEALSIGITAPMLAVNVSDARAVFSLKGNGVREVIAKGAPVDMSASAFGKADFRRTRLGQVAVAFWMESPDEIRVVCFASMREFMFNWLCNAARKNSLPDFL